MLPRHTSRVAMQIFIQTRVLSSERECQSPLTRTCRSGLNEDIMSCLELCGRHDWGHHWGHLLEGIIVARCRDIRLRMGIMSCSMILCGEKVCGRSCPAPVQPTTPSTQHTKGETHIDITNLACVPSKRHRRSSRAFECAQPQRYRTHV